MKLFHWIIHTILPRKYIYGPQLAANVIYIIIAVNIPYTVSFNRSGKWDADAKV